MQGSGEKIFRQTVIFNKNLTAKFSTHRKETKDISLGIKAMASCFHLHIIYSLTHGWVWKSLRISIPSSFRLPKLPTEALSQVDEHENQKIFDNVAGKEPFT